MVLLQLQVNKRAFVYEFFYTGINGSEPLAAQAGPAQPRVYGLQILLPIFAIVHIRS